jgi:hypothetical protein
MDMYEMATLVDRLLEIAEDDPGKLATALDRLDGATRREILTSDFLNAFQVFVFYFREEPTELGAERLILHPAADTAGGIIFEERDIFEIAFLVDDGVPVVEVRAGTQTVARFLGESAYRGAIRYIDEQP